MSIRDNLGSGSNGGVLDTLEEIEANTTPGKAAGALAVKELTSVQTDTYTSEYLNGDIIVAKNGNVATIRFPSLKPNMPLKQNGINNSFNNSSCSYKYK